MTAFPIFKQLRTVDYGLYPGTKRSPDLDISFDSGLTLILGANGLGKTTLVTLLYRMCTGPYELPAAASAGALGGKRLRVNKLSTRKRRLFAERVNDGATSASATLQFGLGEAQLSITRSLESLDSSRKAPLPSEPARLWQNGPKYRPKRDAEDRIQNILRIALQAAFPATVVREEQPHTSGRLDLEIEEAAPTPATFVRHALLELKVLRSYTDTGSTVSAGKATEAIEEGLRQAIAYREERGTLASALCCFDMRKAHSGESCFEPVVTRAGEQKVALRVWPLYGTVDQIRRATT
jgi:energy-coupling factor transporter ATP-binding protein EcfA2